MACIEKQGYHDWEIESIEKKTPSRVSVCPYCRSKTLDGRAVTNCGYSPVACVACGWRPCDGSC